LLTDLEDEHDVVEVRLDCADLTGRPLRELPLPENITIVLVQRNGDIIHPSGNTALQIGDRLTLVGSLESVRDLTSRCQAVGI
jgi:Trk K+ transport system NAD-binding subunit